MFICRILLLSLGCTFMLTARSQVSEDFMDSNFSANPVWIGNHSNWIVNSDKQLQSDHKVVNSSFFISTLNNLAVQAQWEFFVRLNFNPSGVNFVDVFLTASSSDLLLPSTTGYFIRIGNTQDEVSLYRKDITGVVKLIDGVDGAVNHSDNRMQIKVTRNGDYKFSLFRNESLTGNYLYEGSVTDATYLTSAYFGIVVRQSSASFFQKHFFDDILVKTYQPDLLPPSIISTSVNAPNQLDVLFSEAVDVASATQLTNYSVSHGIGSPIAVQTNLLNNELLQLEFSSDFIIGKNYVLTINGVRDLSGNPLINGTAPFSLNREQRFDVLIDEIMADPSPPAGLPNAEFIELKNTSGRTLNLSGWKISTSTASALLPSFYLPADSFIIITSTIHESLFVSYGHVQGITGFPALDNDGEIITLTSKDGLVIHAVPYAVTWYQHDIKREGGWTLEMIDPKTPCAGANNWKASTNPLGGTPGKKNAVDGLTIDERSPRLLRTFCPDSITIIAYFDESLDPLSVSDQVFKLQNYQGTITAMPMAPLFDRILLLLSLPLEKRKVYVLNVSQVKDCQGNTIAAYNQSKVGLPESVEKGNIVINEILFHPRKGAFDYVECFNISDKVFDASQIFIANRNQSGTVASVKKWSAVPFSFYPGDYVVLTENAASVIKEYFVRFPDLILETPSLPSFPNDKGNIILTNAPGDIIDEVPYAENWHFALIDNPEGVALERLSPGGSSSDKNNWHSASSTAGYGTPTDKNSQNSEVIGDGGILKITPKLFSPDNNGHDDFSVIYYNLPEPGYVANIQLFDATGRRVRYLVKNALLGRNGNWTWDGLDDNNRPLPAGFYIVYVELFNIRGRKKQMRNTIVLAK